MKRLHPLLRLLPVFLLSGAGALHAEGLNPAAQARLDHIRDEAVTWAAEPALVEAVVAQNRSLPAELAELTQEKWETMSDKSPLIQKFATHPVAQLLRTKGGSRISEAFVSDAHGRKVAFLSKTSSWSHLGKPKHEAPMGGKAWQGKIEVDRSAGTQQIQIAVPVLSGSVSVGSLVIGVPIATLTTE
jgi:hypothetical protein